MKNRWYKFLVMLVTVIAVGTCTTMLNLSMQRKAANETQSYRPYAIVNQPQLQEETQAMVSQTLERAGTGTVESQEAALEIETMPEDTYEDTEKASIDQEAEYVGADSTPYDGTVQEQLQQSSDHEKQIYYLRLQDMERVYTARMNEAMKENVATQQKTAEELLKIWDDELNAIYQKLRKSLSDDAFSTLRNEERAWIRNRDTAANRAASKENYSNSTQNLAYTRSLLQWTKDRVYELAEMYFGE